MAFPTTSVLDAFTRANAGTLGANWSASVFGSTNLQIISNAAAPQGSAYHGNRWNVATYGPDSEVYVTVTTEGGGLELLLRIANPGAATTDGYSIFGNDPANTWGIYRYDNGVATLKGSTFTQAIVSGDSMGLEMIGTSLKAYFKSGAGAWTQVGSTQTDATYGAAGLLGMEASVLSSRLDNFGGGTVVSGGAGTQTLMTSAVATGEAWGRPFARRIARFLAAASAESLGTPTLQRVAQAPATATSENWGTPTVQRIVRELVFASSESWGSPNVQRLVRALAAATGEAWGTPKAQRILREVTLVSAEAWGVPKLQRIVVEQPFASSESVGRPLIIGGIIGNTITIIVGAIASSEAWGKPTVQRIARAQGIASGEQFGLLTAQRIARVLAVPTSEQVGRPTLQRIMRAAAVQSSEQFGIPNVSRLVIAVNIATGETWGSPIVIGGTVVDFPSVAGAMLLSDRQAYEIVLLDGQTYAIGVIDGAAFGVTITDTEPFGTGLSDRQGGDTTLSDDKGV